MMLPWTRQIKQAESRGNMLQTQINELRRRVLVAEGTIAFLETQEKRRGLVDSISPKEFMDSEDAPIQCPEENKGPGWWKGASVRCTNFEGHEGTHRADGFGAEVSWLVDSGKVDSDGP